MGAPSDSVVASPPYTQGSGEEMRRAIQFGLIVLATVGLVTPARAAGPELSNGPDKANSCVSSPLNLPPPPSASDGKSTPKLKDLPPAQFKVSISCDRPITSLSLKSAVPGSKSVGVTDVTTATASPLSVLATGSAAAASIGGVSIQHSTVNGTMTNITTATASPITIVGNGFSARIGGISIQDSTAIGTATSLTTQELEIRQRLKLVMPGAVYGNGIIGDASVAQEEHDETVTNQRLRKLRADLLLDATLHDPGADPKPTFRLAGVIEGAEQLILKDVNKRLDTQFGGGHTSTNGGTTNVVIESDYLGNESGSRFVPDGVFRNAYQAGDISTSQAGAFDLNTGKVYIPDNPASYFESAPGWTAGFWFNSRPAGIQTSTDSFGHFSDYRVIRWHGWEVQISMKDDGKTAVLTFTKSQPDAANPYGIISLLANTPLLEAIDVGFSSSAPRAGPTRQTISDPFGFKKPKLVASKNQMPSACGLPRAKPSFGLTQISSTLASMVFVGLTNAETPRRAVLSGTPLITPLRT